jgi:adenylate cyclase
VGKVVDPASTRKLAILFADVSGSTTLYEKLGDRTALAAVESVIEILKRAVASNRGRVVKTIGDEVMAVFDTADLAFQAAVDMQTHTDELPAINEVKLGIRIGFHAGPVLEERGDVFGDAVNTAARMAGLAKSGQIITSGPTVDALSPTLREGIRDLDALPVKGNLDEIRVSEVLWQDGGETTMMAPRGTGLAAASTVLRLEHGGKVLRMEPGGKSTFVVGRDPGNDVVIADKMASRVHGRIERRRDRFYYVDQSTNGTYVTNEGDSELVIKRDQIMLRSRGRMCFGPSSADAEAEVVAFFLE